MKANKLAAYLALFGIVPNLIGCASAAKKAHINYAQETLGVSSTRNIKSLHGYLMCDYTVPMVEAMARLSAGLSVLKRTEGKTVLIENPEREDASRKLTKEEITRVLEAADVAPRDRVVSFKETLPLQMKYGVWQ